MTVIASDSQFDRAKLGATVLHICGTCPPDQLGAVKLHKVLYFADMLRYAQTGRPLTGAQYRKRPFGPTCVPLLAVLGELQRDRALEIRDVDYFGLRKKEYRSLADGSSKVLNEEEIALLDEVINFVCAQNSARSISELSHQAPWERAEFGDEIPYSSAYLLFQAPVSQEALDATAGGVRDVEKERQNGNPVVFANFSALRRRLRSEGGSVPL